MDEVIKIFVIVGAIAFVSYQNYAKKEKKRSKASRKNTSRPVASHVEPTVIMSGEQKENIAQMSDNKQGKRMRGEGRKHRNISDKTTGKEVSPAVRQPVSGKAVRLKTAEEARRAFIYSEIFNRKYQ